MSFAAKAIFVRPNWNWLYGITLDARVGTWTLIIARTAISRKGNIWCVFPSLLWYTVEKMSTKWKLEECSYSLMIWKSFTFFQSEQSTHLDWKRRAIMIVCGYFFNWGKFWHMCVAILSPRLRKACSSLIEQYNIHITLVYNWYTAHFIRKKTKTYWAIVKW
jgi:hypothetical protein